MLGNPAPRCSIRIPAHKQNKSETSNPACRHYAVLSEFLPAAGIGVSYSCRLCMIWSAVCFFRSAARVDIAVTSNILRYFNQCIQRLCSKKELASAIEPMRVPFHNYMTCRRQQYVFTCA